MNEVKITGKIVSKGKWHFILEKGNERFRIEATAGLIKFIKEDTNVLVTGNLMATNRGGICVVAGLVSEEGYNG